MRAELSVESVESFWRELEKIASGDQLYRDSAKSRKLGLSVARRESRKIKKIVNQKPFLAGSMAIGLNLPDEVSDIDFHVGTDDVEGLSRKMEGAGFPFRRQIGEHRVHTYETPEGFSVDVSVRPQRHVEFEREGYLRIAKLPAKTKKLLLARKKELKDSGDRDAYKKYKYSIYEDYGAMPEGGDWSSVTEKKASEFAPGLPNKKKLSPVRKVDRPQNWHLVVQHHPAVRSGDHHDIRIIDPVTRIAHSWATKKDFPKPGDKPIRVYQQPDHTERYSREFSGHIQKGYGRTKPSSKGVQRVEDERLEVLQADDKMIRFNFYKGKGPEEFVLVRNKKSGGPAPTWTMLNVTKTKDRLPPDLPFHKPKYKEVAPEAIDLSDAKQVMSAKLDGGHNTFVLQPGQRPRIFSYREPKERKTGAIEHSHKVSDLYLRRVPKSVGETILRGELYGVGEDGPLPGEVVGGMLNANVWRSRELQRRHGALRPAIFDVVKYRGKNLEQSGYREKLKALEEIKKEIPEFEVPDMAFTPEEKKALLNAIREKKHPKTHEGVILWHTDEPRPPIKSKFTVDHDVYVRDVFPAIDSKTGKPKAEAGGFSYSLTPEGPVVGKVGTGFSSALRDDLLRRTNLYRGAVAKIVAEKQTSSGALAKPRFAGWHADKQDESFWGRDPKVK